MGTPADRRKLALSLPPLADAAAAAIERFIDAIWAENGLAGASLASAAPLLQCAFSVHWLRTLGKEDVGDGG